MTDIVTRHDLVSARPPRVTNGEEQLSLEGHLQHPADLLPINNTTTIIPVVQVCYHCCTCVPLAGLWVILLQQWQDMLGFNYPLQLLIYIYIYIFIKVWLLFKHSLSSILVLVAMINICIFKNNFNATIILFIKQSLSSILDLFAMINICMFGKEF